MLISYHNESVIKPADFAKSIKDVCISWHRDRSAGCWCKFLSPTETSYL